MAKVTAAEYADKWARRLRGATEDIRRGIERVDTAPGEKAAQSQDALVQNFMESVNSGLWANRVRSVSLADWKNAASNKGIARIGAGVEQAQPKMQRIANDLLPAVDAAAAKARALPKVTLEDSINRMTTFVREMARTAPRKRGL